MLAVSEIMSVPMATRSPISPVLAFDRVGEAADLGARSWFGRPRGEPATRRALAGSYAASEGHSKQAITTWNASTGQPPAPVEASVLDGLRYWVLGAGAPIGRTARPCVSLMISAAAR